MKLTYGIKPPVYLSHILKRETPALKGESPFRVLSITETSVPSLMFLLKISESDAVNNHETIMKSLMKDVLCVCFFIKKIIRAPGNRNIHGFTA